MVRGGSVYILTNKNKTTLYTGVTSDIVTRIEEHRTKVYPKSFTARYNLTFLVFVEHYLTIEEAIDREKYIKGKTRAWKEDLINVSNPNWRDLYYDMSDW